MKYLVLMTTALLLLSSDAIAKCRWCRSSCSRCVSTHHAPVVVAPAKTADVALIELAQAKDKWDNIRATLRDLGFVEKGAYGANYVSTGMTYAPQGGTPYGYGAFNATSATVDPALLWEMASRHVASAQTLGGQAQADFATLQEQQLAVTAQRDRILAAGHAAAQALSAASGPPTVASAPVAQWRTFRVEVSSDGQLRTVPLTQEQMQETGTQPDQQPQPQPEDGASTEEQTTRKLLRQGVMNERCIKCHGPDKRSKDIDLTIDTWASIQGEARADLISRVQQAITNPDALKRMPLAEDHTAGVPLMLKEKQLLLDPDWK